MSSALRMAVAIAIATGCKEPAQQGPASGPVTHAASPIDIWLTIGAEVIVDSAVRIGFGAVVGDSRCPTSVVCAWAGDAAVEIYFGYANLDHRYARTKPPPPAILHTAVEPRSATFAGYLITLLDLGPYPHDTDPIPPSEYAARLRVERAAP